MHIIVTKDGGILDAVVLPQTDGDDIRLVTGKIPDDRVFPLIVTLSSKTLGMMISPILQQLCIRPMPETAVICH